MPETLADRAWIQTYTGRQFSLVDPQPHQVDPLDIAVGLARTARFGGHTRQFYSVAQHSALASLLVPGPQALEALLHDAAEAYTGDLTRPLKLLLGVAFAEIEFRIHCAICKRFGIPEIMHPHVKMADDRLLLAERRDLMAQSPIPWQIDAQPLEPAAIRIQPEPPKVALYRFCQRLGELHAPLEVPSQLLTI